MGFISQHKIPMIALLGILIAAAIWYGLSNSQPSESLLSTQVVSNADPADQDVVETLSTLRAVTLSGTIFSDTAFMGLKDFGTQIVPEPVGRENPFAPLQAGSRAPAAPRTTQLFPSRP